jgi:hypothetical protein
MDCLLALHWNVDAKKEKYACLGFGVHLDQGQRFAIGCARQHCLLMPLWGKRLQSLKSSTFLRDSTGFANACALSGRVDSTGLRRAWQQPAGQAGGILRRAKEGNEGGRWEGKGCKDR